MIPSGKRGYFRIGLTVFLTVASILVFYDTLFGSRFVLRVGKGVTTALGPVLLGAFVAYLLTPVVNFFEQHLFEKQLAKARAENRMCALGPRAVSLILTFVILSVLSYLLLSVLLPELYKSVVQLIGNLEAYYNTINSWIQNLMKQSPAEGRVMEILDSYYNTLVSWLGEHALPQAQKLMGVVTGGVKGIVNVVMDLIVGLIVSVYLLATKERNASHARKLLYALFSRDDTGWILRGVRRVDTIFSGFVRGKLLDSLIIGIICFVGCTILRFPYTVLISVIVGVTNVIPFFGPFLGAVPSFFLILLVDPIQAFYFLVFILALQQVDGNIIGPKILGNRTGISGLWVIVAILLGGHFFGVLGMFFGVPVLACLYTAAAFFINTRLRRRNLPLTAESYRSDVPEKNQQASAPPPASDSAAN